MPPRADKYRFGLVPKRHFDPTAPLFVTRRLVFRGVTYERGDKLPDDIRKGKRFALWHSNRATNTPVVHFDRRGGFVPDGVSIARKTSPAPTAPPAAPVQPDSFTAGGVIEAPSDPDASQVVAFTMTPGETVHVAAPAQETSPRPLPPSTPVHRNKRR